MFFDEGAVLFIKGAQGFVPQAVIKNLKGEGLEVIVVRADNDEIEEHKDDADVILYYLGGILSVNERTVKYLNELCAQSHKTVCLIGDDLSLREARSVASAYTIAVEYHRPVEVKPLAGDMKRFVEKQREYTREKTVLLVDDDEDFLSLAGGWLKEKYEVVTALSAEKAMDYLYDTLPDLILLDYIMPDLNGYEFLKQIRENHRLSQIPVIFLTGNNDKDAVLKVIDEKPDGYILKVTPRNRMLETIDQFFIGRIFGDAIA